MGEVALLLMILGGMFKFCQYVASINANDRAKLKRKSDDGLTYVDNNGRMRLMKNNHIVAFAKENGHDILKDLKTFEVVRDYTQEKMSVEYHESKEKATKKGKKIFCIDFDQHLHDEVKGMRYQDMQTGEVYVIRGIGHRRIPFYMTLDGKKFIPVDKNWHEFGFDGDLYEELNKFLKIEKESSSNFSSSKFNYNYYNILDIQYCGKYGRKD